MAKIEMDISEYDAMRENKKLLEDSLKREQELGKQLLDLNQQKMQALEDAKMKVVKISKKITTQHVLVKKESNNAILNELGRIFGISTSQLRHHFNWETGRLIDALFNKVSSESQPTTETTVHGLDEIKLELRNEIKANIDSDIQTKLDNTNKIEANLVALNQSYLTLGKDYDNLLANNISLETENKTLKELNSIQEIKIKEFEMYSNKGKCVEQILSKEINFWNRNVIIQELKMLFKKVN